MGDVLPSTPSACASWSSAITCIPARTGPRLLEEDNAKKFHPGDAQD
jgi:hypothetical protein